MKIIGILVFYYLNLIKSSCSGTEPTTARIARVALPATGLVPVWSSATASCHSLCLVFQGCLNYFSVLCLPQPWHSQSLSMCRFLFLYLFVQIKSSWAPFSPLSLSLAFPFSVKPNSDPLTSMVYCPHSISRKLPCIDSIFQILLFYLFLNWLSLKEEKVCWETVICSSLDLRKRNARSLLLKISSYGQHVLFSTSLVFNTLFYKSDWTEFTELTKQAYTQIHMAFHQVNKSCHHLCCLLTTQLSQQHWRQFKPLNFEMTLSWSYRLDLSLAYHSQYIRFCLTLLKPLLDFFIILD